MLSEPPVGCLVPLKFCLVGSRNFQPIQLPPAVVPTGGRPSPPVGEAEGDWVLEPALNPP